MCFQDDVFHPGHEVTWSFVWATIFDVLLTGLQCTGSSSFQLYSLWHTIDCWVDLSWPLFRRVWVAKRWGLHGKFIIAVSRTGWTPTLPTDVAHLDGESRQRYMDKLAQLGIDDPHIFSLLACLLTYLTHIWNVIQQMYHFCQLFGSFWVISDCAWRCDSQQLHNKNPFSLK